MLILQVEVQVAGAGRLQVGNLALQGDAGKASFQHVLDAGGKLGDGENGILFGRKKRIVVEELHGGSIADVN